MHPTAQNLIKLRERIETLSSLAPGHGYDSIGQELTDIAGQPSSIQEAHVILAEAEAASPGLINKFQDTSIKSEMELELFHAGQLIGETPEVHTLHDRLFQDYQYDWFSGRAGLEASFIPTAKSGEPMPVVCYFGSSGIPFTALAVQRRRPSQAFWFDPFSHTRDLAKEILRRLDIKTIEMHSSDLHEISDTLKGIQPAYASVLDAKMVTRDLLAILRDSRIDNISFVTTHGLNELLYPSAPQEMIEDFFEFKCGYYPERLSGMPDDWKPSAGLSFVSLALYQAR